MPSALAVTLALWLLAAACRPEIPDPAELPRPRPNLGQMEPTLRAAVLDAQRRVEQLASASDADPEDVGQAYGELGELYHAYELRDAARQAYDNAARLRPGDFRWRYLDGLAAHYVGDYDDAERRFREALEIDPDSVAAWLRLAEVHLAEDLPEEAEREFRRALELDPESAAAHYGLGRIAAARDELDEAARRFERTLELDPDASSVHYPLSQVYRRLGRAEDADRHQALRGREEVYYEDEAADRLSDLRTLTSFRVIRTLAAQPGDLSHQDLLALTLTHLGNVDGSIEPLARVLRARAAPGSGAEPEEVARLHYLLGGLLVYRARDAEAIDHFRRALELAGLEDAAMKLGNALARTGRLEEAVEVYSRLIAEHPEQHEARVARATAWLNLGRVAEARRELEGLRAERPDDPVVLARLAETYEVAGRPAEAEASFRRVLEQDMADDDRARLHRGFGDFLRRHGRLEAAAEQYRAALGLQPGLDSARTELANSLALLGRYREAAVEYRRVIARQPQRAEARQGEAVALLLAGDLHEARSRLEESVAAIPSDPTLAHLLARLLAAAPDDELRDGSRSVELARRVLERAPSSEVAETLAMAFAESGRYDEAARMQQRVVASLPPGAAARSAAESRRRLYAEGQAWHARTAEDLVVARATARPDRSPAAPPAS